MSGYISALYRTTLQEPRGFKTRRIVWVKIYVDSSTGRCPFISATKISRARCTWRSKTRWLPEFCFFGVVNHQKIGGFFAVKIMGFNNGLTWFSHV
jgi:hypothetical protein